MQFKEDPEIKSKFNPEEGELIKERTGFMSLKSKEFFLKEDEVSDKLGILKSGLMRTFVYDDEGEEVTTQFFEPGNLILSADSFNNKTKAQENIAAIIDSELLINTYDDMMFLYEKIPHWKNICLGIADRKNDQALERMKDFQTLSASQRYLKFCDEHPEIIKFAPLKHIASYLGIDIATLSRIRKKV